MSAGVQFDELVASEAAAARAEVVRFAAEEYLSQGASWRRMKAAGDPATKPRPPSLAECRAMSRRIRLKRERQATHFNDTTDPYV